MLSAVIIARNEADRIVAAIESVAFADEIIVLDSGSDDETVAVATAAGARVVRTDWPGFVAQKARAWAEAKGEWVLSIDADERVGTALRDEIREVLRAPTANGYSVPRRNVWLGHALRHGHWYPDRKVRLARQHSARWGGTDPHDVLVVSGPVSPLQNDLTHVPYRSLREHLDTIERYASIGARNGSLVDIAVRPVWHFFSGYILRLGFLDGVPGLMVACIGALGVLLKWSRARL